ncbi:MAG: hypothetical protein ACFFBS_09445, partial [Promethearchaeota archaeon]
MTNKNLLEKILGSKRLKVVKNPKDGEYIAWCVFHKDGEGKPPHKPNLHFGFKGFNCFACGEKGTLRKLAAHLGIVDDSKKDGVEFQNSGDFENIYDYCDEEGQLLFQVVRKQGKKFFQRRPDGKGGWIWDLEGVRRVLYNLSQLINKSDEVVFIVEGEKDADVLIKLGLLATTNSGGADQWRQEYNEFLKGREIVILPDNDEPGLKHAKRIAKSLHNVVRSTKLVELPGLIPKGDVSDWLTSGHTIDDLLDVVSQTEHWKPSNEDELETEEKVAERKEIVDLVLSTKIKLFHDEREIPYAAVPLQEGHRNYALGSKFFKRWVSHLAWKHYKKAFSQEILEAAHRVLCGMAIFDGPEYQLNARCARTDEAIWIDLDSVKAIRVTSDGWGIISEPPVLFRSFESQQPLPHPVKGGDPKKVLNFINLYDEDAQFLFLCYLVVAFVPDIPVAALIVHGVQGTAKTTLLRIIKRLLDPSVVEVRGGVRNNEDFILSAFRNRVLFFDNITSIPEWVSDALCRAVTGDGLEKRTLYTDEDMTIFRLKRVVGIAGINLVANRPDLLDRSVILSLDPIPEEDRRDEESFWKEFEEASSEILGGLLDALSKAMSIVPKLKLESLPRMADFARWGAAVAEALGHSETDFLHAYNENINRQNEAAIASSPVAQAVIKFMEGKTSWQGTPSELLAKLESIADATKINIKYLKYIEDGDWE